MRSRLQFLTNLHFQLKLYNSCIKLPPSSYWGISTSLFGVMQQFKNKKHAHINGVLSSPLAFHASNQLDQSSYCLLILSPIYWHSHSYQNFTPVYSSNNHEREWKGMTAQKIAQQEQHRLSPASFWGDQNLAAGIQLWSAREIQSPNGQGPARWAAEGAGGFYTSV